MRDTDRRVIDATITVTAADAEPAATERVHSWLIFVGYFGDRSAPSSSHALDDVGEVRFHRGPRSVKRGHGGLALAFPDGHMSTAHGRWVRRGERWVVEDPSSKNGTVVDGVRAPSTVLRDGAVIELGHTCFVFRHAPVEAVPAHLAGDVKRFQIELAAFRRK